MAWRDGYIAVDWGTTNRRAYLLGPGGTLRQTIEDEMGVLAVLPGSFPSAIADLRGRLGNRPVLLAGMVGSNRGWVEAPYVACPAGLDELVPAIRWVEQDVGIVPGVSLLGSGAADVMRGEEVQILGAAAAGLIPADVLACHPGTHAKWVKLESGMIRSFRTMMTGELFALLKEHSILSDQLQAPVRADEEFRAGVARARDRDELLADLFSVRARTLLGRMDPDQASSFASGLLIGSDIGIGLRLGSDDNRPLALVGRADLTHLYAAALAECGRSAVEIDGAEAFLAGTQAIAEQL